MGKVKREVEIEAFFLLEKRVRGKGEEEDY